MGILVVGMPRKPTLPVVIVINISHCAAEQYPTATVQKVSREPRAESREPDGPLMADG